MVFVLDRNKKPLMPCSEKRARLLLERGRARVHRIHPFVIRLVDRKAEDSTMQPVRLKLDPGSRVSGIALVREKDSKQHVLWLGELAHRGRQISEALTQRRTFRRRRRSANLRYRAPRFANRRRPEGWLAPSLKHRIATTLSWVCRLRRWTPVSAISTELVRFDTQALQSPEISGVEYQQGTLFGCEVRGYLLEKWGRKCAYCDAENVPLNIDHIQPKSKGGSDRISNLALACVRCNQQKGSRDIGEFLAHDPQRLARIEEQLKAPLKDAAAVNATRWALFNSLKTTGLPVEASTGGRTRWNRQRHDIPKSHALDAACVGQVETILGWSRPALGIKCTGRGSYQRTRLTRYGFPRGYLMRQKQVDKFQTGDLVKAKVPTGKKKGNYQGRLAVRASGSFDIQTSDGVVQGIKHDCCTLIQRADGYGYRTLPIAAKEDAR